MRQKFIVRKDDALFGIIYDNRDHILTIGGPRRCLPEMLSFLEGAGSVEWKEPATTGSQTRICRWFKCHKFQWEVLLHKHDYQFEPVRRFRRLMQ